MHLRFTQPLPCILHLYQLESSPLAERTLSVYNTTRGKGLDLQTHVGVKRGEICIKSRQILFFFKCLSVFCYHFKRVWLVPMQLRPLAP